MWGASRFYIADRVKRVKRWKESALTLAFDSLLGTQNLKVFLRNIYLLRLRKGLELREYLALPKRHEEPSSYLPTWDTSLKGLHGT
jgi:hypothetical protein